MLEDNAPKRAHGELGPCMDKDCGYDTCISQREDLTAAIEKVKGGESGLEWGRKRPAWLG